MSDNSNRSDTNQSVRRIITMCVNIQSIVKLIACIRDIAYQHSNRVPDNITSTVIDIGYQYTISGIIGFNIIGMY